MKGTLQAFKAVASGMIGVGKEKNLAKDFEATEKTDLGLILLLALL